MSLGRKIAAWRSVKDFCARRIVDYGELMSIEFAEAKTRVLHELIAMVALIVGAMFTLSFVSIAVIVTAVGTPHLILTAWCVAGAWLAVALIATAVIMTRKPTEPFQVLRDQFERDAEAIRKVLR
ncbi:phage holin family protein [Caballeronia sp. LZ035]|nr:phage holin family protein [Caballeronia sp. LZ035]